MKAKLILILLGISIGAIVTLMNACGQMYIENGDGVFPSNQIPTIGPPLTGDQLDKLLTLANFKEGESLYQKHCLSCHKPSQTSQNRDVEWGTLRAIVGGSAVDQMSNLKISNQDLEKIWLALKYRESNFLPQINPEVLKYSPPIGTANLVASKLNSIFNPPPINPTLFNIIRVDIGIKNESFNEHCTNYDKMLVPLPDGKPGYRQIASSNCTPATGATDVMSPSNSVLRQSYLEKICRRLLGYKVSILNALNQINLDIDEPINKDSVEAIIDLFFPGMPYNSNLPNSLLNIANEAQHENLSGRQTWSHIMLPLCSSIKMDTI